jgi:CRP-like cAMP-binding protein
LEIYCLIRVKTNEAGKELITGIQNTGEFFGHQALFDGLKSSNTVEAIEDTEIAIIPQKDFFGLIHNNADVALKLLRFISSSNESAEERLLKLAYDSA